MDRIARLAGQVARGADAAPLSSVPASSSPDDVVICAAVRSPLTKAKKGGLRHTMPEDLVAHVLKHAVERGAGGRKELVEDVIVGNVLQVGAGAITARQASFLAGFDEKVAVAVINRQCSSGLQACASIAGAIRAGYINCGIGAGVEHMSSAEMTGAVDPEKISASVWENQGAQDCLIPMGNTSDNVSKKFNISRADMEAMAVNSHAKAAAAQAEGRFDEEIAPIKTIVKVGEDEDEEVILVEKDDGIRAGVSAAALGKLKPAFGKNGVTTAGTSSQVTDGAAAVLLASRRFAEANGMPIIGMFVGFVAVGCPPEIMGIGPAVAIPAVLKQAGLKLSDVDIFELNEAFASQALYCQRELGIPDVKLNPKGGAMALGHPLGCTGARLVATLLPELKRTGGKYGIISMCIGTGMGAAAIVARE